ncbi:hypothetical protein [Brucella intermedia]|uniref:hypothetical protein n=1 Tax=Brucella intermedia TaxID=94625 RepID=UPI00158C360E|nr:hypothetical protein [Brucella intermedia]NYD84313.1 hypothetical protein [Brucella intermedia]
MAIRPDYDIGTVTLTSGSSDFTTSGSSLQMAAVQAGDAIIAPSGHVLIIASITGQNSGTLFLPCPPDAAGTDLPLRIRFQPDGSRYQGAVRVLIDLLSSGNVEALAGLDGEAGKMPVFTGVGTMGLADYVDDPNGTLGNLGALTLGSRQILQTDGSGNLGAITLAAKQILQTDANGALTKLSLVANKQLVTNSSAQVALVDDKTAKTISTVAVSTPVAYVDISLPSGYEYFDLILNYLIPATNAVALGMQFSTDNGATFFTGNDYRSSAISVTAASTGAFGGAMIATNLVVSNDISNIHGVSTRVSIHPGSSAGRPAMSSVTGVQASFGYKVQIYTGSLLTVFQRVTTIRVFFSSGNISSGRVTLIGAVNG